MGQEKRKLSPVVLDTNVLVSALLFSGKMGKIVTGWKSGAFVPAFSRATFDEFSKVLTYPKFCLTVPERRSLIEDEVLPYCAVVKIREEICDVCRDQGDDKFLACAVAAGADCLVSGDKDLLALGQFRNIPIITVADFLRLLPSSLF